MIERGRRQSLQFCRFRTLTGLFHGIRFYCFDFLAPIRFPLPGPKKDVNLDVDVWLNSGLPGPHKYVK